MENLHKLSLQQLRSIGYRCFGITNSVATSKIRAINIAIENEETLSVIKLAAQKSMKTCRSCGKKSIRVQCDNCRDNISQLAPVAEAIRNYSKASTKGTKNGKE